MLLVIVINAQSQIVNVENKRTHQSDTSGVFGNVDLGVNLVENGSTILTLRGGAQVEWLKGKNLWLSSSNFNLVKVQEESFVNNGFQHFRYNYNFNQRWTYEAFTQAQFNEKTRIKLRALVGTGARLTIADTDKSKAFWGVAYMFEYNEISDTNIINRDNRLSTYLSFNWQPVENLTFSGTSYYQPILPDFNKARLSSLTTVQIKITDKLSFKTTFQITYDGQLREDAPDVPATTYSLINGLRWDF